MKMTSDIRSRPVTASPNDVDISDRLSKLLVLDLTQQIAAPMKAKGIIRTSGIIPTLPSPGIVHRLFAEHFDDPGGAMGRLDGQDKHDDDWTGEQVFAGQERHADAEPLPVLGLQVP